MKLTCERRDGHLAVIIESLGLATELQQLVLEQPRACKAISTDTSRRNGQSRGGYWRSLRHSMAPCELQHLFGKQVWTADRGLKTEGFCLEASSPESRAATLDFKVHVLTIKPLLPRKCNPKSPSTPCSIYKGQKARTLALRQGSARNYTQTVYEYRDPLVKEMKQHPPARRDIRLQN